MSEIYAISGDILKSIADTIRNKCNTDEKMKVTDMPDLISSIRTLPKGVHCASQSIEEYSKTITFQVKGRPWAIFVVCDSDIGTSDAAYTATRFSAIYTLYGDGVYAGGRVTCANGSGRQEHYAVTSANIVYDEKQLAITTNVDWSPNRLYTLIYYVMEE